MSPKWTSRHWSALFILALFVILAALYSLVVPAYEAPDEIGHYGYIQYLRTSRALPMQQQGSFGEAHQPPLYYAVAALFTLPADISGPIGRFIPNPNFTWTSYGDIDLNIGLHGSAETFPFQEQALALHLARAASVLMGLVTIAVTFQIGWLIFPTRPIIGLLSGGLVAFNPQFLFISGAINNDNLLILAMTGTIWQTLRVARQPEMWRPWIILGVWVAVAILAKISGFTAGLIAGIALLALALDKHSWRLFVRGVLAMGLTILLITGWWFVRNQALYGDPLGLSVYSETFAANLRQSPLQWSDLSSFFSVQFQSFWGRFGWMNVPAPVGFYRLVGFLLLVSLIGLAEVAVRRRAGQLSTWQKRALLFLAVTIVVQEIFMIGVITTCNQSCYQGRYMFPVISALMVLVSLGLVTFLPRKWRQFATIALLTIMAGLSLWLLAGVVRPAYDTVTIPRWRLWFLPNKTEAAFGQTVALRGYDIDVTDTLLNVTLYWQAQGQPDLDYSSFVHLVDGTGQILTQEDQVPGYALNYYPTEWRDGDIVADERSLAIPAGYPLEYYVLRVGVYNWSTGERLPLFAANQSTSDFITLVVD